MEVSKQTQVQHLLWRAGFGISTHDLPHINSMKSEKLLKKIFNDSNGSAKVLEVKNPFVKKTLTTFDVVDKYLSKADQKESKAEAIRDIDKQNVIDVAQLSTDWMNEMVYSKARLREKVALFWHGHFACIIGNSLYAQQLLNIIRQNALGNFEELLKTVSKSAAMIAFLNNQQNTKKHPNENFAREVMELFTLGRGHYTENDVKEAAKAFTGWQYQTNGNFIFKTYIHDNSTKTFLGQQGTFTGDDILDIILSKKQTAIFITQKIYKFFVNDKLNDTHITWLSNRFFENKYDINKLMFDIFSSDWFYDKENIGIHIKSPVEYIIGIRTFLPMSIQNEQMQIMLERLLGQWLFNPPNVAGWPGGQNWIDSSSLMLRLKIPGLFKNDDDINLKSKLNDDIQMGSKEPLAVNKKSVNKKNRDAYQIVATIDWNPLIHWLGKNSDKAIIEKLNGLLIQFSDNGLTEIIMDSNNQNNDAKDFVKYATIALMSTPEYQLS